MSLKIEIERPIYDLDAMPQVMLMVGLAAESVTIRDFINSIEICSQELHLVRFGAAGSHAWVSDNRGKRILFITENK